MKITRFADVPKFVRDGSYEVDIPIPSLERTIAEWTDSYYRLDLDPDFQRGHVWDDRKRVAYLEFFLKGGKSARVIYFNCPWWHQGSREEGYTEFVLVDGKQRLTAWRKFMADEFKVFGSYFSEFTDHLRAHQTLKFNVNDLKTRAEVLQWYLDFNSGGVVHTEDELARVRKLLAAEKRRKDSASPAAKGK